MHVLVLCKRQYTARDLLDDRYGRLYEIPEGLARRDHQVSGIALSYRRRDRHHHRSPNGVQWTSINILPWGIFELGRQIQQLRSTGNPPEVVWASSDAPCAILGQAIAKRLGIPCVIDLYDNYESFGLTRIPGVAGLFQRACRRATALTAASQSLADYVASWMPPSGKIHVVGNAAAANIFHPMERDVCRSKLGLPLSAKLIGCAGALTADRGIEDMFIGFMQLAESIPDLHLVVAGPRDSTPNLYRHPRIIDLGVLTWQSVPFLINSLDVSVVCNRDDEFGRYCYPLKLHESLACGRPIVAASVGDIPRLAEVHDVLLYTPGSPASLSEMISRQLAKADNPTRHVPVASWDDRAAEVAGVITSISL